MSLRLKKNGMLMQIKGIKAGAPALCFFYYSIVEVWKTTRLPALHLGSDYSCEQ